VVYYTLARYESLHSRMFVPTTVLLLLQLDGPSIPDDPIGVFYFCFFSAQMPLVSGKIPSSTVLKLLPCVLYRSR
jgi:hypothetical protein